MQLLCTNCEKNIEYSGDRPRFCAYCGGSLTSTIGPEDQTLDVTLDATPGSQPSSNSGSFASGAPHTPRPKPTQIGGYRIKDELGRGGMGAVYEAEEIASGRRVALKLLAPQASASEDSVERFLQEGRYAASLSHPQSTFVYAAGEDQGRLYIVMELMEGGTLKELVDQEGPLPIQQAVDFALDIIAGLESAHSENLIHRDLKPSNCFLDTNGRAKVGDFGLSKSLVADAGLTRTGAFMGTPMFAAPEQVKSERVTVQTDVYAVGATLYHLLTGRGPYEGDAAKVIAAIVSESPPSMRSIRPEIPRGLDRAVAWAMEKQTTKRPANLAELREQLEPFSSRDASYADLGRRLAAFSIDTFVFTIISSVVATILAIVLLLFLERPTTQEMGPLPIIVAIASVLVAVAYFALAEWKWGKAVGKYALGLRVTNDVGAAPLLRQTLLRAAILPGLQIACTTLLPLLMHESQQIPATIEDPIGRAFWLMRSQVYTILGWGAILLCLATMRPHNGFKGVHEILSGTWVRRDRRHRSTKFIVTNRSAAEPDEAIPALVGPFEVLGDMGPYGGGRRWLANDPGLDRKVWIVLSKDSKGPSPQRRSVARSSRLRWLQGGKLPESDRPEDGEGSALIRWDAYEAVQGGPFPPFTNSLALSCNKLSLLAGELSAAIEDDTLPDQLTADQFWIDEKGAAKLLDRPEILKDENAVADDPTATAHAYLSEFVEQQSKRPFSAAEIHDLRAALRDKPRDLDTLQWAESQLRELGESDSRGMTWDERLGVVTISATFEWAFLNLASICILMTLFILASSSLALIHLTWATLLPLLLLPACSGYFFSGGAVFAFAGVRIRRLNGDPVSPFRSMCRTLLAWAPACISSACLSGWLVVTVLKADADVGTGVILLTGLIAFVALHLFGAVYAIASPQRNLPDYFTGTYLTLR